MSQLTPQQEEAIATFKENLHLPGGGFHLLIIELCKEFQLPFQKVRNVLMKAQTKVEKKIRHDFSAVCESDITQETWLNSIRTKLAEMAQDNVPVMDNLLANEKYKKVLAALNVPIQNEYEREDILEELMQVYEKEVFKPLLAMLHTTKLYWKLMLAEDLNKMTTICREQFSDYPQHMEAAKILFELDEKVRAAKISE
ncbi:hypothetical protein [Vibrio sp. 99-70-13A1]|uniref:hypothetical protein n=1 Tax=Vibrio sp. 99-70-13A1 TaxID=2607601 RepID=UPI0014939ECB|nr:hypothetical protein [Vibrio sp. 99-70-13A1]NOH97420.1 hypothetical protein [Vibrio sp. 99-70-13A1]